MNNPYRSREAILEKEVEELKAKLASLKPKKRRVRQVLKDIKEEISTFFFLHKEGTSVLATIIAVSIMSFFAISYSNTIDAQRIKACQQRCPPDSKVAGFTRNKESKGWVGCLCIDKEGKSSHLFTKEIEK